MPGMSNGPNIPPLDDPVAEAGSGMARDSRGPGEPVFEGFAGDTDAKVEALRRRGWTGACGQADDSEAHPS